MDIIYILVPLSLLLIGIAVLIFFWAVKSGQFEDMESPAHRILFDDDEPISRRQDDSEQTPSDKP
ncbi:cbb3-type cytochrome oxidase assembly protein CcoS [Thalassolituus sp. ST750PaO-4]|uniref:cbb3-type cytochrome oxidase assembly protein CcoS n=1 Tax=Thalassolituus sp. ST750PaO-4 TaxID=2742965 RepID=UPI001CE37D98|nr:cbb3-type cytochrome oxidase assembly protein CcoS [Thalassolituus sp. ST750PaO-4]MCA6060774.1 cbb3-type cytochrome oxidase assembly protein CcoS [Thalassolituus sp. ST750PaO-4]